MQSNTKKIGIALSGASSRSIFYIGFLEVMNEAGVKFDYIAACSGATIVAGSYAAGTMELLKQRMFSMRRKLFFQLLEYSSGKGGIYNLDTFEAVVRFYTKGLRFEDLPFGMGFIASDVVTGKQIVLNMGDLAHAARVSCTLPGLCEPTTWGNKVLVDGGLVSVVPGDVARSVGCDVVVGIDMRGNRHIFSPLQIEAKKVLNALRASFLVHHTVRAWQRVYGGAMNLVSNFSDTYDEVEEDTDYKSVLSILNRSLDMAISAQKHPHRQQPPYDCDLLIAPEEGNPHMVKRFMRMLEFERGKDLYELGRTVGKQYLPEIEKLKS